METGLTVGSELSSWLLMARRVPDVDRRCLGVRTRPDLRTNRDFRTGSASWTGSDSGSGFWIRSDFLVASGSWAASGVSTGSDFGTSPDFGAGSGTCAAVKKSRTHGGLHSTVKKFAACLFKY